MGAVFEIVFLRRAAAQVDVARRWWEAERPEAPRRLDDELAMLVHRLARHPRLGVAIAGTAGVRRVTLATTRYAVYYRVRPRARRCEVIEVVHASRVV